VIVPIWKKEEEKAAVLEAGAEVQKRLKAGGVRVKLDANEQRTPGWKFNFWEMKVGARIDPFLLDRFQVLEEKKRRREKVGRKLAPLQKFDLWETMVCRRIDGLPFLVVSAQAVKKRNTKLERESGIRCINCVPQCRNFLISRSVHTWS
jgi:hypothetical protein